MTIEVRDLTISDVSVSSDALTVDLSDGRSLSVPLGWYPRLWHGTEIERNDWRLIGRGLVIHWPQLDEDVSLEGLLLGKASNESQNSLKRWLDQRNPQD